MGDHLSPKPILAEMLRCSKLLWLKGFQTVTPTEKFANILTLG
jgi:hypothetical protein